MNKLEVADLIEQIPQDLTPDEFLVALATKAAEWERERIKQANAPEIKKANEYIKALEEAVSAEVLAKIRSNHD